MNILMYHPTMDIGGAQINNMALAARLQERGHKVTFLADTGALVAELRERDIGYRRIVTRGRNHASPSLIRDLVQAIRTEQADIVWTAGIIPCLQAHLACWLTNTPLFPLHGSPNAAPFYLPRVGICGWVNPHHRDHMVARYGWPDDSVVLIRGRMEVADCSEQITDERAALLHQYDLNGNEHRIALVGRVVKDKWGAISLFLEAAQELGRQRSNVQFLLVGGADDHGESLARARKMAAEINQVCGREVVALTDEIREIHELMRSVDVVAGMASTCIQSMLCARPTLVIGNRRFSEIVTPDTFEALAYNHFNVHEPSTRQQPDELCRQIESLLENEGWRAQLAASGRQKAVEVFDVRVGARQLEQALQRAITLHRKSAYSRGKWLVEILRSLNAAGMHRLRKATQVRTAGS